MQPKLLFLLFTFYFLIFKGSAQVTDNQGLNTDSLKRQATIIKKANKETAAKTHYKYYIIKADSSTYGYSIFADGQLYIWQTTVPGMKGSKGFISQAAAGKCAELVIQKIKEGEMPPSLTEKELRINKLIN